MPDTSPRPTENVSATTRRGIRWDALAAIIASFVGLLALVVAGYTAYIQREQVRAQVWPYLEMGANVAGPDYAIAAANKGVGPAIVRSVQVLVDGKPVPNWVALFHAMGVNPTGVRSTTTLNRTVLSPGDHVRLIVFANAADIDSFVEGVMKFRVEARVCYSSTLGESWLLSFAPGGRSTPQPVSKCPVLPAAALFSD